MRVVLMIMVVMLLVAAPVAVAQPVAVPNASFEQGTGDGPEGWRLEGCAGAWGTDGAEDAGSVIVTGTGEDSGYWRTVDSVAFEPGAVYQLSFRACRLDSRQGAPTSGPIFCNRDLHGMGNAWEEFVSVFSTPDALTPDTAWLRFGQWRVEGSVAYDDIRLVRAQPVYRQMAGLTLGDGERVEDGRYTFVAPFDARQTNHARPLSVNRAWFNTSRWVFGADSEVAYAHHVGGLAQTEAEISVTLNYHESGELVVEASGDGAAWVELGTLRERDTLEAEIPPALLPAETVRVRLRSRRAGELQGDSSFGSYQIAGYTYRAALADAPAGRFEGQTHYLGVEETAPGIEILADELDAKPGEGDLRFRARVMNTGDAAVQARASLRVHALESDAGAREASMQLDLAPGVNEVELTDELPGTGAMAAEVELRTAAGRFHGGTRFEAPVLHAAHYGELLPGGGDAAVLWWASSGWKVSRERRVPRAEGTAVRLAAARNEAESAQVVVRANRDLAGLHAAATDLTGPDGAVIPAAGVDLREVRYVNVTIPTDSTACAGWWPDPLPPFGAEGVFVPAGANQPIWITVTVPEEAPAGTYRGEVLLRAGDFEAVAPLEVEVFDFTLPRRATCQTAFGFSANLAFQYHGVEFDADQRAVYADYLRMLSDYRIAPYSPAACDPMRYTWPEVPEDVDPADWARYRPAFDWTGWDAAVARGLDEYGFNVLRIPVPGMGGGTFHSRTEPVLLGFKEDDPRYQVLFRAWCDTVQEHLREKGWLNEAFVYWFDEPDPKDYAFVMNGFRKLKDAAPDLTRMLTEQVEPELIGGPNLWCPISPDFDMEDAEARRAEGERFWWYVCTAPKGKYATLFIDHAATELRVWLWQTWQRKIDGILVWQSNYWTSSAAYPDTPQNPYEDPMGWTSGYSTPAGNRLPWGNGDGRFVYPPVAAADGQPAAPVFEPPVPSIRLAMLRDGVEDYEYHAMLARLLEARRESLSAADYERYAALLTVPESVTRTMTEFTRDPAPIEARRAELAEAIAELSAAVR
jgi:hypothetical protein